LSTKWGESIIRCHPCRRRWAGCAEVARILGLRAADHFSGFVAYGLGDLAGGYELIDAHADICHHPGKVSATRTTHLAPLVLHQAISAAKLLSPDDWAQAGSLRRVQRTPSSIR
jgi:hypothetical protein